MLNRARDAHRNIQLRRNDLARLSDLERVVRVPGVDRRARGADRGAEGVGEGDDGLVKGVLGLDAAAAGDDDGRGGEVRSFGLDDLLRDPLGLRCRVCRSSRSEYVRE